MRQFIFFLLLITSLPAFASSPVWEISAHGNTLYLGGTIHLLAPEDYPLPQAFDQAYAHSSIVVFETDLTQMSEPEFQRKLLAANVYATGTTLASVLNKTSYDQLNHYLQSRNIPIDMLNTFKPGMLSSVLTLMELQRLGMAEQGVDVYFNQQAIADKKPTEALESLDAQISFISTLGEGLEDPFIQYTLAEMDELPEQMAALKALWRVGDTDKINSMLIDPLAGDFPSIYNMLIVERNQRWLPQIHALLTTEATEFVLVGYAHLLGEDGLLKQLEQQGFTIEQR